MGGKDQHLRRGVQELRRGSRMKPEHGREWIANGYGIDVRQLGAQSAAERGIFVERKSELHVSRGDTSTIVPLRPWIEVKRQRERVAGPVPAVRERRAKSFFVPGVKVRADVSEIIIKLLSDLLRLRGDAERREKRPRIRGRRYNQRASCIGVTGSRRALSTTPYK